METSFTREARRRFCEFLAETGNITTAARRAGIARSTVYDTMLEAKFAAQVAAARDVALDRLRAVAYRRAVRGVEQPFVQGGSVIRDPEGRPLTVRRYSDRMLLYLMKHLTRENNMDIHGYLDFDRPEP